MRWLLIIGMVAMSTSNCSWSRNHQIMMGTYVVAHAVDIVQTREILSNERYYELNPALSGLSAEQATGVMIASTLLIYVAADNLPEYRTWIIAVPMFLAIACVFNNMQIGVEF